MSLDCIKFEIPSDISDILPTFDEIHKIFTNAYRMPIDMLTEFGKSLPPDFNIKFPKLPSFDDWQNAFDDIDIPSVRDAYAALSVYSTQLLAVLKEIADKIFQFIGRIPFPNIMPFDFSLSDFFSFQPSSLIQKIKEMGKSALELLPEFPEIFFDFGSLAMEYATILVMSMVSYVGIFVQFVTSLIKKFLEYLDSIDIGFPEFPPLPNIPTFDEIYDQLKKQLQIPDGSDILEYMKGKMRGIIDAIKGLKFPDLDFTLPDPLFPKIDIPSMELVYSYGSMISQMFGVIIKKLKEYVDKLPLLSDIISWPTIKDWLKVPEIPRFCANDASERIQKEEESQKLFGGNVSPVNKDSIFDNLNQSGI